MRFLHRVVVASLGLATVTTAVLASGSASTSAWDLGTLAAGKTYPTNISISNASCPGVHTLELSRQQLDWVEIVGSPTINDLPAGHVREVQLVVDLRNKEPGTYSGDLRVRCLTCPRSCAQDVGTFRVMVKVTHGAAVQSPATPLPKLDRGQVVATPKMTPAPLGPSFKVDPGRQTMAKALCRELEASRGEATRPEDLEAWKPFCSKDQSNMRVYGYQCTNSRVGNSAGACATTWIEQWLNNLPSCELLPYYSYLCARLGGKYSQWVETYSLF